MESQAYMQDLKMLQTIMKELLKYVVRAWRLSLRSEMTGGIAQLAFDSLFDA